MPKGIKRLSVFAVGGGDGGWLGAGSNTGWTSFINMSGGGGGYTITKEIDVDQLDSLDVSIGTGGQYTGSVWVDIGWGSGSIENHKAPGNTVVGEIAANAANGVNGGSGGGGYGPSTSNGNGGSDGSDGGGEKYAGKGQGTTTRAFGESTGTLYAGGGGGGTSFSGYSCGTGGEGGGGTGQALYSAFQPGSANTGGGGGGGFTRASTSLYWKSDMIGSEGGSGIAIIRYGY